jgi:hypothetical protein
LSYRAWYALLRAECQEMEEAEGVAGGGVERAARRAALARTRAALLEGITPGAPTAVTEAAPAAVKAAAVTAAVVAAAAAVASLSLAAWRDRVSSACLPSTAAFMCDCHCPVAFHSLASLRPAPSLACSVRPCSNRCTRECVCVRACVCVCVCVCRCVFVSEWQE